MQSPPWDNIQVAHSVQSLELIGKTDILLKLKLQRSENLTFYL